jgi:hypothetical protein
MFLFSDQVDLQILIKEHKLMSVKSVVLLTNSLLKRQFSKNFWFPIDLSSKVLQLPVSFYFRRILIKETKQFIINHNRIRTVLRRDFRKRKEEHSVIVHNVVRKPILLPAVNMDLGRAENRLSEGPKMRLLKPRSYRGNNPELITSGTKRHSTCGIMLHASKLFIPKRQIFWFSEKLGFNASLKIIACTAYFVVAHIERQRKNRMSRRWPRRKLLFRQRTHRYPYYRLHCNKDLLVRKFTRIPQCF